MNLLTGASLLALAKSIYYILHIAIRLVGQIFWRDIIYVHHWIFWGHWRERKAFFWGLRTISKSFVKGRGRGCILVYGYLAMQLSHHQRNCHQEVDSPPTNSPPRGLIVPKKWLCINHHVCSHRITYPEFLLLHQAYSNLITELLLGGELVGGESTCRWRDGLMARWPITCILNWMALPALSFLSPRHLNFEDTWSQLWISNKLF